MQFSAEFFSVDFSHTFNLSGSTMYKYSMTFWGIYIPEPILQLMLIYVEYTKILYSNLVPTT